MSRSKLGPHAEVAGVHNEGAIRVEMGITASLMDTLLEEVAMLNDRLKPALTHNTDAVEVRPEKVEEALSQMAQSQRTTNNQLRIVIESISYLKRNVQI